MLPLWLLPPLNPCTCALVAIVVLAGCLAQSFSIFDALNGVDFTHIVPRTVAITWPLAHALRAIGHGTPREGEYAIPQLGQDIRAADDDDDGEDGVTLTRRPTRRDGAQGSVRPLVFAGPTVVPIASINELVDALDVGRKKRKPQGNLVRAQAATTNFSRRLQIHARA